MGLYIVANVDGHVISSKDGINWSEPFDTGITIGKAAVGPNKIVYTRCDVEEDMDTAPGLYYASAWNQTPVLAEGTDQYYYNEVHYLGEKFVAVGYQVGSPKFPAFSYSEDGVSWTIGQIDPNYIIVGGEGDNIEFTDVGYNGMGYFITSKVSGENLAGGFYTADLSQELNETNFVSPENFPTDANQLLYTNISGGENFGSWSAFSDDRKTWFSTFNDNPQDPWNFISGLDLTDALQGQTGLTDLSIQEATVGVMDGYMVWMLSTENGQIIWWPHIPAGPFVSVPNPHTTNVSTVNNLNPLEVILDSENVALNNEKITIIGSTGLAGFDGTYFVESLGDNSYRLHSNVELNSTIDASGWVGTYDPGSATVLLSRGTFIDALGYGDGKFFAGNDDEEVFMCTGFSNENQNLVWTKVDDQNDSFEYWNDVDYGDFGCSINTIELELSPDNAESIPNYKFYGEGNMDTAIIIENGKRKSIQRTGYFDYLDGCGNRKVLEIKDGETATDQPEVPQATNNPNGHPTFGSNDIPSIIEQVIPTGNPLVS